MDSISHAPLVSVIIPTYNRGALVVEAAESVLAQTYEPIEVIVVDDGSTDDTQALLAPFGDRLRVIRQENQGVSIARNAGMRAARGAYVSFLNSDDVYRPEKIERQMRMAPGADEILYCKIVNADLVEGSGLTARVTGGDIPWLEAGADDYVTDAVTQIAAGRYLHVSGLLARRETLETVGTFDPRYSAGEDVLFMYKGALRYKLRLTDDPLVLRRMHETQTGLHREKHVVSLIGVTATIIALAREHGHSEAVRAAMPHLANNLSKLANIRANQGHRLSAAGLAIRAFSAWPRSPARVAKAAMFLVGWRPPQATR